MAVQNIEAKYITSDYFVSELTKVSEEGTFVNPNLQFAQDFRTSTNGGNGTKTEYRQNGIEYLEQSCLPTCALLHMYNTKGASKGKVKWCKHRSLKDYPPPTYESISEMCGVPFQESGGTRSLPMSLTQLEPFLSHYGLPCYVINPRGDLVYRYIPNTIPSNMRLGICGLTLIISNGHVNQIPDNLSTKFANTYKDVEPLVSDTKKKLILRILSTFNVICFRGKLT
jgi:hypothetical protein